MTKSQALNQLRETRQISTGMLPSLGISFDSWLRYVQLDDATASKAVDVAITMLEGGAS